MGQFEAVEIILKQYRENKADYQIALQDFNKYYDQLLLHEKSGIECKDEVIAAMAVSAQKLSDVPRSETNKFYSSTEDTAIHYRYYLKPSQLEIKCIKEILQEKAQLLKHYDEQIQLVDNMLKSLTNKEKYIIEHIYIEGFKGTQTMLMWNEDYPNCAVYDINSIYSVRDKALQKMMNRLK